MDWFDEELPRRFRRRRRVDREEATDELRERLEELRDEVRRVEAELMSLRGDDAGERESSPANG